MHGTDFVARARVVRHTGYENLMLLCLEIKEIKKRVWERGGEVLSHFFLSFQNKQFPLLFI